MNIYLHSLGCAKNLVDSEVMTGVLKKSGYRIVDNIQDAEIGLVNTCAFVQDAKDEAIDAILEMLELKKQGKLKKVIVAGCLPQRYQARLKSLLPEVDGFLGPANLTKISSIIHNALSGKIDFNISGNHFLNQPSTPRVRLTPPHYAFIKIADGCNNRCGYCVIPMIRGRYQSRTIASIAEEAQRLAKSGVKEINLISQDSTFYGADIYGRFSLDRLLRRLVKIPGINWIRVLYTHPAHYTSELLKVIANEDKVCKYIDVPLQHINSRILKLMRRKTTSEKIKDLIADIRAMIPEAALRTSLIVGFPQETDAEFRELYDFVKEVKFDRLGVFKYSPEEKTPAGRMSGQIPEPLKEKRLAKIMTLQQGIITRKNEKLIGAEFQVLVDERQGQEAVARSQFDAPDVDGVIYVRNKSLRAGDMARVKIVESCVYDLIGEKI